MRFVFLAKDLVKCTNDVMSSPTTSIVDFQRAVQGVSSSGNTGKSDFLGRLARYALDRAAEHDKVHHTQDCSED